MVPRSETRKRDTSQVHPLEFATTTEVLPSSAFVDETYLLSEAGQSTLRGNKCKREEVRISKTVRAFKSFKTGR